MQINEIGAARVKAQKRNGEVAAENNEPKVVKDESMTVLALHLENVGLLGKQNYRN